MQLFLALECIHCLLAQCFFPEVLENCESTVRINKSRTLPRQIICQLKERPRFIVLLGARGGGSPEEPAGPGSVDVTAANQGKDL